MRCKCKNNQVKTLESLRLAPSSGALNGIKKLLANQEREDAKFNILRVFGIGELEIRHSFMLKWLLSPTESHGLQDMFLKLFLESYLEVLNGKSKKKHPDRYRPLQCITNYTSFVVDREVKNIDLLLFSTKEKIVIAIENKWNAGERVGDKRRKGQLEEYSDWVRFRFPRPKWRHYFIFLTLDKRKPHGRNALVWDVLGYESIARILDDKRIFERLKCLELTEQELLMRHYAWIVKRKLATVGQKVQLGCKGKNDKHGDELYVHTRRVDRRDSLLQALYNNAIDVGEDQALNPEKSESSLYVQYKRRFPSKVSNSVHYEVFVGLESCRVCLHIEEGTSQRIRARLRKRVSAACKKVGFLQIVLQKDSCQEKSKIKACKFGGAEIVIFRRGRTDEDVEIEIRQAVKLMYKVFEPILQDFETSGR